MRTFTEEERSCIEETAPWTTADPIEQAAFLKEGSNYKRRTVFTEQDRIRIDAFWDGQRDLALSVKDEARQGKSVSAHSRLGSLCVQSAQELGVTPLRGTSCSVSWDESHFFVQTNEGQVLIFPLTAEQREVIGPITPIPFRSSPDGP